MPAKSKAQQRFMGMVHAVQKGDMKAPLKEVSEAASSISPSDAKDFASTKQKGLPDKTACDKTMKKLRPKNKKQATDLMAAYVRILASKAAKNQKSASDSPLQRLAPAIQKHGDFFKALNEVYANKTAAYRVKIAKGLVEGLEKKIAAYPGGSILEGAKGIASSMGFGAPPASKPPGPPANLHTGISGMMGGGARKINPGLKDMAGSFANKTNPVPAGLHGVAPRPALKGISSALKGTIGSMGANGIRLNNVPVDVPQGAMGGLANLGGPNRGLAVTGALGAMAGGMMKAVHPAGILGSAWRHPVAPTPTGTPTGPSSTDFNQQALGSVNSLGGQWDAPQSQAPTSPPSPNDVNQQALGSLSAFKSSSFAPAPGMATAPQMGPQTMEIPSPNGARASALMNRLTGGVQQMQQAPQPQAAPEGIQ